MHTGRRPIWPAEGCYKYEQFYYFFNSGAGGFTKANFQHLLKIYGDGYKLTHGVPTSYKTHWRADTDIIDSGSDKYERYTTSWTAVSTEANYANDGTNGEDGTEWRTYDNNQGVTKRAGIAPVITDNANIYILLFKGTKASPLEIDGNPGSYVTGESVSSQDDVYWYRADRPGSQCNSSSPCTVGPIVYLQGCNKPYQHFILPTNPELVILVAKLILMI